MTPPSSTMTPPSSTEPPRPPPPPPRPRQDPMLHLELSRLAFHAYQDAPPDAPCHVLTAPVAVRLDAAPTSASASGAAVVPGAAVVAAERATAPLFTRTHIAFTDPALLRSVMDGVISVRLELPPLISQSRRVPPPFVVVTVGEAVAEGVEHDSPVSLFHHRDGIPGADHEPTDDGVFRVLLFASKSAYDSGARPVLSASTSLLDLLFEGRTAVAQTARFVQLSLKRPSPEDHRPEFFYSPMVSPQLAALFRVGEQQGNDAFGAELEGLVVSAELTFTLLSPSVARSSATHKKGPTPTSAAEAMRQLRGLTLLADHAAPGKAQAPSFSIASLMPLRTRFPNAEDWHALISASRTIDEAITDESQKYEGSIRISHGITPVAFIESRPTDTQLWMFRDAGEKTIVASFRGTDPLSWRDVLTDAKVALQRWRPGGEIDVTLSAERTVELAAVAAAGAPVDQTSGPLDSAVHFGFLQAYMSVRHALHVAVALLVAEGGGMEEHAVVFTGHSLGGALAVLAAADFQAHHRLPSSRVACVTFGAPRVGNVPFVREFEGLVPNATMIVNGTDVVPLLPPSLSNDTEALRYAHGGRTVHISDEGDMWVEEQPENSTVEMVHHPLRTSFDSTQEQVEHDAAVALNLLTGRSVMDHMEDEYFSTIKKCVEFTAKAMLEATEAQKLQAPERIPE